MTTHHEPDENTASDDAGSGLGGSLAGVGFAALMMLCCAAPALIAAGALGVLGAWLASPWVIGGAVLLLVVGVGAVVGRRRGGSSGGSDCC
jgi:hypothetical protein